MNKEKIPTVCVLCGNPLVKDAGEYVFRTYTDLEQGAELLSKYIKKNNFKKIAILTETNSFTSSIRTMLESRLNESIIFSEEINPDETNYASILTKVKIKKPDAIYLNMASPASYQNMIRQLSRQALKQQLFSYNTPNQKSSIDDLGSIQEGIIFFDLPDVVNSSEQFKAFLKAYYEKYPNGPESNYLLAAAFNGFSAIITAVEKVGENSEDIKNFLIKNEVKAATGTLKFDINGDLEDQTMVLKQIKNGKTIILN